MKYDSIETGGDNYFSNAGAGLLLQDDAKAVSPPAVRYYPC